MDNYRDMDNRHINAHIGYNTSIIFNMNTTTYYIEYNIFVSLDSPHVCVVIVLPTIL